MPDYGLWSTPTVFCLTVLFLIRRPGGLHVSVPTAIGSEIIIACGFVPFSQLLPMLQMVDTAITFQCHGAIYKSYDNRQSISLVFSLLCLFFWTRWLIGQEHA